MQFYNFGFSPHVDCTSIVRDESNSSSKVNFKNKLLQSFPISTIYTEVTLNGCKNFTHLEKGKIKLKLLRMYFVSNMQNTITML